MALNAADKKFIAQAIAEALASTVVPTGKPAQAKAESPRQFYTRSQIRAGEGFACTADGGCGRLLGTAKRAAIHGIAEGGHAAAAE